MRPIVLALGIAAAASAAHAQAPIARNGTVRISDALRLSYLEQGPTEGPVLVLLHGFSDSSFSFSRLLPLLPASCRVLAVDLRGHGDSDRPRTTYRLHEMAADVVALLDTLGIARFSVVGHSMGSFVAQHVAALAPARVEDLVLMGSGANGFELAALDSIIRELGDPVPAEFISEFQYGTVHVPLPHEFMARVMAESAKLPLYVWQRTMPSIHAHETPPGIAARTFILWGDQDAVFDRAQQDALLARIPGARLAVYEETGHAPHWERPERVARDLVAFLGSTQ